MEFKHFSTRQRKIIIQLIKTPDFVTAKELSERLDVSKRTVHRELSRLKDLLKNSGLSLISKTGVGVTIEGEDELLSQLEFHLEHDSSKQVLTPKERRRHIIQEFLLGGRFQKLTALAHKFSVTEATISYDIKEVSDWFEARNLSVVRKQGIGVKLEGSETAFRRALLDFFYQNVDEEELWSLIQDSIEAAKKDEDSKVKEKILTFIQMDRFSELEKTVKQVLEETDFELVDSSYIGLMMHLALAIKRLQMGETIYIDPEKLIDLKPTSEYEVAKKIAASLEEMFDLSIPEEELGYITMHLKGAKLRKDLEFDETPWDLEEVEVIKLARVLVKEVGRELDLELAGDYELISGLATHLEPVISRLEMGLKIRNPVLDHLKNEYEEIFLATKRGAKKLEKLIGESVPEEEVGFLSMHIAAAVENSGAKKRAIKALVVCSSGIGSSKILASRLKKTIDNLEIVKEISAFSLKDGNQELKTKNIDLIISTIPLKEYKEKTVIVSPILLPEETAKVESKIAEIKNKSLAVQPKSNRESGSRSMEEKLEVTAALSQDIINLLDDFNILTLSTVDSYSDVIKKLDSVDFLPASFDLNQIKNSLIAREEQGPTIIPEMELSLLHARTEGVDKPFIGLIVLEEPIEIFDSYQNQHLVDRILVLLAPKDILEAEQKLISNFSASIIDNEEFYQIVKTAEQEEFLDYLRKVIGNQYHSLIS